MTSKKMAALISSGMELKGSAAKRGERMLPVLLIEGREEAQVLGLTIDKRHWSTVFETLRKEARPHEAVLTVDAAFKHGPPGEVRPREDPAAEHCILVIRVRAAGSEVVLVPYFLDDHGKLVWREPRVLRERGLIGSMLSDLQSMVRP